MKKNEDLSQYKTAYQNSFKFNDENQLMLQWYASRIIQKATVFDSVDMLSLGIGHGTVSQAIIRELEKRLKRYVIVEGSRDIIEAYNDEFKPGHHVELIHSYFENYHTDHLFDVIEMGFILEHVDDPEYILKHYRPFLKKNGIVFISVPNAKSLHRLIGKKAGLLKDVFQLSDYDLQLGHKRYFDLESIKETIKKSGLKVVSTEGVFLKPVTTDQLRSLNLSNEIMIALLQIGMGYPDISNAILIEARN